MIDFQSAIRAESARFSSAVRSADAGDKVPSCPGWDAADLTWHLAEVQYFWASIVEGLLAEPSVPDLERPADADLPALFDAQTRRLVTALDTRDDAEACWSWASDHTVGFVRRRQAHEAAIHRVDAELAARIPVTPLDDALAEDGIQELFDHMVGGELPPWATFTPDGSFVRIATQRREWVGEFGRFRGTSPDSGRAYDLDDIHLADQTDVAASVTGDADAVDRWLWGRGDISELSVEGDVTVVDRLRATIADTTS